jgi:hypothetical protein
MNNLTTGAAAYPESVVVYASPSSDNSRPYAGFYQRNNFQEFYNFNLGTIKNWTVAFNGSVDGLPAPGNAQHNIIVQDTANDWVYYSFYEGTASLITTTATLVNSATQAIRAATPDADYTVVVAGGDFDSIWEIIPGTSTANRYVLAQLTASPTITAVCRSERVTSEFFFGTSTTPAVIYRYSTTTHAFVHTYTANSGEGNVKAIAHYKSSVSSGIVYVLLEGGLILLTESNVNMFRQTTFSNFFTFVSGAVKFQAMIRINQYLFVSTISTTSDSRVLKINRNTMSVTEVTTSGATGHNTINFFTYYQGEYMFGGTANSPGRLIRFKIGYTDNAVGRGCVKWNSTSSGETSHYFVSRPQVASEFASTGRSWIIAGITYFSQRTVRAWNRFTGVELWSVTHADSFYYVDDSGVAIDEYTFGPEIPLVIVANYDKRLYCYFGNNGSLFWNTSLMVGTPYTAPVLSYDTTTTPGTRIVYVHATTSSGRLYSFRCTDGSTRWENSPGWDDLYHTMLMFALEPPIMWEVKSLVGVINA